MEMNRSVAWYETALYVLAWLTSIALLAADLLLIRGVIISGLTAIGLQRGAADPDAWRMARLTYGWVVDTIDRVGLLLVGCGGIAGAILIEHFYRKGMEMGVLARRVIRVTGIELAVGVLAGLLTTLLTWLMVRIAT